MDSYDLHPDRVAHVLRQVERQLAYQTRLCLRLADCRIDPTDSLCSHTREAIEVLKRQAGHLRRLIERHHVDGVEGHASGWQEPKPTVQAQRGVRCGG